MGEESAIYAAGRSGAAPASSRDAVREGGADELAERLEALARDECYAVEAVLKDTPGEVTQLVFFVGENGARLGPFVRKYLDRAHGLGDAYRRILARQREGHRFAGLPRIYECFDDGERLAVVMEAVVGCTLQDVMEARRIPFKEACGVFLSICDAVAELHEAFDPPLIHRDLKPSNIMVCEGSCVLIDLGIARTVRGERSGPDTTHFGTRGYAPPEQFGFAQTDARSDVYSLGMVLFYCLTGEGPDEARQRRFSHADVPEPVRKVVEKATALDPGDRFQSVRAFQEAFVQALDAVLGPEGAQAGVDGEAEATEAEAEEGAGLTPSWRTGPSGESVPRGRVRSLLSRVPQGIGIAWNTVVTLVLALLLAVCVYIVFHPASAADVALPLWGRALEYVVMMGSYFVAAAYFLLDKRRLRRRFPSLGRVALWKQLLVVLAALLVASFAVVGILQLAA